MDPAVNHEMQFLIRKQRASCQTGSVKTMPEFTHVVKLLLIACCSRVPYLARSSDNKCEVFFVGHYENNAPFSATFSEMRKERCF